ncbi:MAG: polysaccharide deacetylase family protein [Verrucomicrobiota bacterium]|nr:polysaccharide deacetylase family protein [Verrucomicrobiota bacterium]
MSGSGTGRLAKGLFSSRRQGRLWFVIGALASLAVLAYAVYQFAGRAEPEPMTGIVLSFDDRASINSWGESLQFLQDAGIKATFFVDKFDAMTPEQIETLRELARRGNEIGSHGFRHVNAAQLIEQGMTAEEYLDTEIHPSIQAMKELGFECKSFAYPFGATSEATDAALKEIFVTIRKVGPVGLYYDGTTAPFVGSQFIDGTNMTEERIEAMILKAQEVGGILSLGAHKIGPEGGVCWCSYDTLKIVADLAKKHRMPFYTMSELAEPELIAQYGDRGLR